MCKFCFKCFLILLFWTNIFYVMQSSAYAQNSISGHIFDSQRTPVPQINVELSDEFSRTISRSRTDNSGRYLFSNVRAGRYIVKVITYDTNFEEQNQEVEIYNMTRQLPNGGFTTSGFDNAVADFYMRVQRNSSVESKAPGTVFVQEVPAPARKAYDEALAALDKQDANQGIIKLQEAVTIFPTYYQALEKLGVEQVKQKNYAAAQPPLMKAVEINPRSYSGWYTLGYSYFAQNNFPETVNSLNKSIELNNSSVESLLLLGVALRYSKQFEEAEKRLLQAKKAAKKPIPDIHWNLALLYNYNLKKYGKAADELELYLKSSPKLAEKDSISKLIKQLREKERQQ